KKDEYIEKLIDMYKIRIKTLKEFVELTDQFFVDEYVMDEKGKRKYLDQEPNKQNVNLFAERLEKLDEFKHDKIEEVCRELAEEKNFKAGDIIHPTRMAISGKTRGAGLFEMMELLGKQKVIERLKKAAGNS
ncbi:MAG: glutamate--tRNA ligase, partial [Candidatus Omnitrophota bacterium]